jgi:alpha-N-acetylglucosaminidase
MDLALMGRQILQSMKKNHPEAVWVIQAWQANPRPEMIDGLEAGDLLVLDLSSENRPMWGDSDSPWCRKEGYKQHHWLYCMLLNYGGNVGMYGRMERIMEGFNLARNHPNGTTLRGVGLTMEGIENNPVMYELMLELPWREKKISKEEWLEDYVFARYGVRDSLLFKAWRILGNTVYHCPRIQEGTTESLFCARPAENLNRVSSWGSAVLYYEPEELRKAAAYFLQVAHRYRGNNNFEYDLIDVVRQVAADYGNELYQEIMDAYQHKEKETFSTLSRQFLDMIWWQDRLLSCRPEFMLGRWLQQARKRGMTQEEKQLYEWNARTQITVWGPRQAADRGGLRDYAHREWAGLLKDYYYRRWKIWFEELQNRLDGHEPKEIDWYALEEPWTRLQNEYPTTPQGNPIQTAQELFQWILHKKR